MNVISSQTLTVMLFVYGFWKAFVGRARLSELIALVLVAVKAEMQLVPLSVDTNPSSVHTLHGRLFLKRLPLTSAQVQPDLALHSTLQPHFRLLEVVI